MTVKTHRKVVKYKRIYTIVVDGKSDVRGEYEPMTLTMADEMIRNVVTVLDDQFAQRSVRIEQVEDIKK